MHSTGCGMKVYDLGTLGIPKESLPVNALLAPLEHSLPEQQVVVTLGVQVDPPCNMKTSAHCKIQRYASEKVPYGIVTFYNLSKAGK